MAKLPKVDKALLYRFFNNECSNEERAIVQEWLIDPENYKSVARLIEEQWSSFVPPVNESPDIDELLERTKKMIPQFLPKTTRSKRRNVLMWALAAACVGILSIIGIGLFIGGDQEKINDFVLTTREVKSNSGEVIEKILPDGTKVVLNAASSLEYSDDFLQRHTREVRLNGEAYFDVVEDKAHPFIVKTKAINVIVLGTAFYVKSYDDDPTVETTLIRGSVRMEKLADPSESVELKANQRAIFSRLTDSIELQNVKAEAETWKEGSLRFEDEKMNDVIKALERWYGVQISLEDTTGIDCRLTAQIDKESLAETLEVLQSLTGIEYSINGKNVQIKGKFCNN